MQTPKLVAVQIPNERYVIRVKHGPRLGTIFSAETGWYYQFDGTPHEGPQCRDPREAMEIMEAVAEHEHMIHEEMLLSA